MVLRREDLPVGSVRLDGNVRAPGVRSLAVAPDVRSLIGSYDAFLDDPYLLFGAIQTTDARTRAHRLIPVNLEDIMNGKARVALKDGDVVIVLSLGDVNYLASADVQAVLESKRPPLLVERIVTQKSAIQRRPARGSIGRGRSASRWCGDDPDHYATHRKSTDASAFRQSAIQYVTICASAASDGAKYRTGRCARSDRCAGPRGQRAPPELLGLGQWQPSAGAIRPRAIRAAVAADLPRPSGIDGHCQYRAARPIFERGLFGCHGEQRPEQRGRDEDRQRLSLSFDLRQISRAASAARGKRHDGCGRGSHPGALSDRSQHAAFFGGR